MKKEYYSTETMTDTDHDNICKTLYVYKPTIMLQSERLYRIEADGVEIKILPELLEGIQSREWTATDKYTMMCYFNTPIIAFYR